MQRQLQPPLQLQPQLQQQQAEANARIHSPSQQPNYPGNYAGIGTGIGTETRTGTRTGDLGQGQGHSVTNTTTVTTPPPAAFPITTTTTTGNFKSPPRREPPAHHVAPGFLPPPFRNRAVAASNLNNLNNPTSPPGGRIGRVGRLWNPTNSTPRSPPYPTPLSPVSPSSSHRPAHHRRPRRPSTPPPPPVPVSRPVINVSSDPTDPDLDPGVGTGEYPLLTLPENLKKRHRLSASTNTSAQIEGRTSGDRRRISLPRSVRYSSERSRAASPRPHDHELVEPGPSSPKPTLQRDDDKSRLGAWRPRAGSVVSRARALSFGLVQQQPDEFSHRAAIDKGKGKAKAIMSPTETETEAQDPSRGFSGDLERGPDVLDPDSQHRSGSRASFPDGMPSPTSSSDSSIMGDPDQPDASEEWGPQHPCFPHLNPHVPLDSPEYAATRIIRIRRDWLVEGDLAPTFSNLYPEILDPAGVSEQEFRRVVERLNRELVPIFSPYAWRNVLDALLGLFTGWLWDDLGLTYAKTRLRDLEAWIEQWNAEMEKTIGGSGEGVAMAPKIVSLRRTGYMSVCGPIISPEFVPVFVPLSICVICALGLTSWPARHPNTGPRDRAYREHAGGVEVRAP